MAAAKKVVRTRKIVTDVEQTTGVLNASYVPNISVSEKYVPRKLAGGVWDKQLLDRAREQGENILLMGDTGSGKTLLGEAYASRMELRYYSLPCDVSIDPSALFGKVVPTEEAGKFVWQDGPVTELVRLGGVFNISEINFMPPKIAASLFPLLDGRRYIPLLGHKGEVVRAHLGTKRDDGQNCWCGTKCDDKTLLIVADMNPMYRGTIELNAAFKNRFVHKQIWGYDDDVEKQLVKSPTLRDAVAKRLRDMYGTEVVTPTSTNMLMEFERLAGALGVEFASSNFVNAYDATEREAVSKVLELNASRIASDLKFLNGGATDDDDSKLEEIQWEFGTEV